MKITISTEGNLNELELAITECDRPSNVEKFWPFFLALFCIFNKLIKSKIALQRECHFGNLFKPDGNFISVCEPWPDILDENFFKEHVEDENAHHILHVHR